MKKPQVLLLHVVFGIGLVLVSPGLAEAGSSAVDLLEEARVRAGRGEDLQATPYYRKVLGLAEQELGESSIALSRLRLEVGALHLRQGRLNEAKTLFEHAASNFEASLGNQDPQLALALAGLAAVNLKMGQDEQARDFWARTREIVGGLEPAPAGSAAVFAQLAPMTPASRRRESPRELRNRLEEAEARGDVPAQISAWRRLGSLQLAQGREEQAASAYEQALDLQRGLEGDAPALVPRIDELAQIYQEQGSFDSVIPWLELALQIEETRLGPGDARVAARLTRLGLLHREAGRQEAADTYLARAVAATDRWILPTPVRKVSMPGERPAKDDPVIVVEDPGDRAPRNTEAPAEPADSAGSAGSAVRMGFETPTEPALSGELRYWAQLASRQDEAIARTELEMLRRDLAPILAGLPARVEAAELGEKGTWYRLQVGAFESREKAAALCDRLADSGHDGCWVVSQP